MTERIEKKDLVRLVAMRVNRDEETVGAIVEGTLEEIYEALKRGESVSLRDFGSFYVRSERGGWVFKFNPSQRLCKLFGWSSTYRGEPYRCPRSSRPTPIAPAESKSMVGLRWGATA